jgi:hypothetical protein
MRRHFTHLAALSAGCLALVWACGYEAETPVVDAAEMRSPLFDHENARNRDAQVDVTAACIDIEATLREWQNADGDADTNAKRKRLIEGLVVMTTVAFQSGQLSTDANVCSTSGTNTCSTSGGPGNQGPLGCSTSTGTSSCTTNNGATGAPFNGTCSTTASSGSTCSVFVPVGGGGNRSVCSTSGQNLCSAGINGPAPGTTKSCSTAGGWGNVGDPNGTAACSAMAAGACSATAGTTCSTYQGSHQSCSAGMTGTDQTQCTALVNGGASCSVNNASNGAIQNKCSAIGNENTGTGLAGCSAATGSTCSVYTTGANAACSSFPTAGQNPKNYLCSVNPSPPAAAVCSTVSGGVVTPPTTLGGNCGSGTSH